MDGVETYLTSEVARILRVDETTVQRWVKSGVLEATWGPVRPGSLKEGYHIPKSAIGAILAGEWNTEGMKV